MAASRMGYDLTMSNDAPDRESTTDDPRSSADTSSGEFDSALIPQEKGEAPHGVSANRAKADTGSDAGPDATGTGDESTDPNAQPPA